MLTSAISGVVTEARMIGCAVLIVEVLPTDRTIRSLATETGPPACWVSGGSPKALTAASKKEAMQPARSRPLHRIALRRWPIRENRTQAPSVCVYMFALRRLYAKRLPADSAANRLQRFAIRPHDRDREPI